MPRTGPRRAIVAVRLSEEQIARLDAMAEKAGVKRSDVVRDAIDAYLEGQEST